MTLRQLPPLPARRLPPRVEHRLAVELNATVVGRTDLTDAVMVLRVRPDEALPFAAGQYVSLGMMLDGRLVQRPYSPASSPAQRELELLVRHVRGGELTPHLWRLANGDRVRLGRAKGLFRLEDDDERQHLFVATGTGVAPMIAMIGELLQRPSQPKITLLHGVGHQRELAFADRIGAWQRFIRLMKAKQAQHPGNDLELLGPVNVFFNRLPYADDLPHWGVEDYWATPAEMVASNGGDCEDYSIAKYFALKELGVPIRRLRITYVKAASLNRAHMVLAYYPEPDAQPLILDNLSDEVKPASQRPDLTPVYSFNDEDLLIARAGERGFRAGSALQVRIWRGLLDKLEQELKY